MFVDQTKIIWRQFGEFRQRDEHADENSPFVVDETMMKIGRFDVKIFLHQRLIKHSVIPV